MKHLKQEFDKLTLKELLILAIAVICQTAGIICIFLSMFIEPRGEIHNSVLMYYGLTSSFCGALLGISQHYQVQLEKFKASVINSIIPPPPSKIDPATDPESLSPQTQQP